MSERSGGLPLLHSRPTPRERFIHVDIDEAGKMLVTSKNIGADPIAGDTDEELAELLQSIADYLRSDS